MIRLLEKTLLPKLSPFLIGKIISSRANLQIVKKITSGNLHVEVNFKKYAENLIKMKTFLNLKYNVYPHEMELSKTGSYL